MQPASASELLEASSLESLPDHLVELVLSRLPAVPLLRCLLVSQRFQRVVLEEPTLLAPVASFDSALPPGSSLLPGESLLSPNGRVSLIYQRDANLVLYTRGGDGRERPVWALQTVHAPFGHSPGSATLSHGGRLSASHAGHRGEHEARLQWRSPPPESFHEPPFRLAVLNSGVACILDANDERVWVTTGPNVHEDTEET